MFIVDFNMLGISSIFVCAVIGLLSYIIASSFISSRNGKPRLYLDDKPIKMRAMPAEFDWTKEKPRPYRPFKKGTYHMTMGLKKCDPNDWLLIDDTYLDITNERAKIVHEHPDHTVLSHPMADESVFEVYDLMVQFLVDKFPRYFVLTGLTRDRVHNKIRDEVIPRTAKGFPNGTTVETIIRCISENVQEDFLILIFSEETQEYYMRSGSFAFPSGFDPAEKMNLALKDIHGPVPFYKEKLEKSMDKFFARLKVGEWVERANWTVQTHDRLYVPGLNHAAKEQKLKPLNRKDQDFDNGVLLRCERQILTRLPKTKNLLFTIRTYTTPLSVVRSEGRAGDLVEAIRNIPPEMAQYKKVGEWGGAVQEYLSERVRE